MVTVSREEFEYQMVPWIGRDYAAWLRTSARPHGADEHRLVRVPERIYRVFQSRSGRHATPTEIAAMGYPRLPEDDELWEARQQELQAAAVGDTQRLAAIHKRVETLEQQLDEARKAVERWRRADPAKLEEQIAWELTHAPHGDVLVGIA